jgi:NNP family nitrate/nitrite transporter-like MFS transporter
MAVLVLLSVTCQQSAGLSFGVVPFVSKRSTGLVSGFVGAGGNVGELSPESLKSPGQFQNANVTRCGTSMQNMLFSRCSTITAITHICAWGKVHNACLAQCMLRS